MAKTCTLTVKERAELQTLLDAYDIALNALLDGISEIVDEWETEIDEKSDLWKDSDAGTEAQERLDTLSCWREEFPEDAPGLPEEI